MEAEAVAKQAVEQAEASKTAAQKESNDFKQQLAKLEEDLASLNSAPLEAKVKNAEHMASQLKAELDKSKMQTKLASDKQKFDSKELTEATEELAKSKAALESAQEQLGVKEASLNQLRASPVDEEVV